MPDLDDSGVPAACTEGHALSRRSMLKGAAGAGAVGIAAAALAGAAVPAAAAATGTQLRTTRGPAGQAADEAIVVHVRDAASGEIDVFRGTNMIRLHDRDLVARLVRASR